MTTTALQTIDLTRPRSFQEADSLDRRALMQGLSGFLKGRKGFLAETVSKHMDTERMLRLVLGAAQSNSELLLCTHESILLCLMDCARLGLEPTGPGGVWIIPFRKWEYRGKGKDRKRTGRFTFEATAITDYRGELALARRSGELTDISAHAVYEQETFELLYGDEERLVHKPVLFGPKGKLRGFYAIARLKNGGVQRAFMNVDEVNTRKERSRAKDSGPWKTDFEKMALKTVIREVLNLCPMSIEYREWVEMEEARELLTRTPPTVDITATVISEEPPEPEPEAPPERPRSARAASMAAAMREAEPEPEPEEAAPVAEGLDVLQAAQEAAQDIEEAPPAEAPEPPPVQEASAGELEDTFAAPPEPDQDKGLNELRGKLFRIQTGLVETFEGDHDRARALWAKFLATDLNKVETVGQGNTALTKARTVEKRARLAVEIGHLHRDLRELDVRVPDLPEGIEREWTVKRLEATSTEWAARLEQAKAEG